MEQDYDPIQEYIESLKKVISEEICWGEHHHNARHNMLSALCNGFEVNPAIVAEIKELEAQACAI